MKQVMRESLLIKLPVIIGDLFLLNLSWILALTLYPQPACIARSLEIFAYLNICFIPGLSWFGVILSSRIVPYEEIIRRVFYVVLCHLGFFVLIQTVWSYGLLPVHLMGTFYIVLTVLLMLWRYICRIVVNVTRGHGRNARRVIIVGSKDNAVEVYHEMVDNTSTGYRVLGYFSNHNDHTLPDNTPCLGSVDEALPWLEAHPVNEVYCCLSTDRYAEEIFPIMDFCENNFVRFFYVPNLRNYMKRTMNLELLGNVPILYIREEPLRQASNRFIKRAFDVTVSSLFLCTLFPFIYIFVAIGTKLTSRGPVLFLQERSGENGQTFRCIKFRSMRVNADADRVQATRDDPRKTRFGDFLRRSSIDELPQFINVLKGDMSIVGPRPHMLQHTEQYSKLINKYMVRHLIKPGITGWAQVTGYRGETHSLSQMEGRVRRDIYERHHLGGWQRNAFVPDHEGRQQAVVACLRQADGLLPFIGVVSGWYPRHPPDLYARGFGRFPSSAGRRLRLRGSHQLCRAAVPGRSCAGVPDRLGFHRGRFGLPGSGRQHLPRLGLHGSSSRGSPHGRGGWQGHSFRLSGRRPAALRGCGVRRCGQLPVDRGETGTPEIELRGGGSLLLPQQGRGCGPGYQTLGARGA